MLNPDRNSMRDIFFVAWEKYKNQKPLTVLEDQLIKIILAHSEYHEFLNDPQKFLEHEFFENNPFLHMSLHMGLREQLSTDRPKGIVNIFKSLCVKYKDEHIVEHKMMECLGKILWEAQHSKKMPEESVYLELLKSL